MSNKQEDINTWHILGLGSMGCLFAAALHDNGCAVRAALRSSAEVDTLQGRGGIQIESEGVERLYPVQAELLSTTSTPISNLLVTTKAHQVNEAIASISQRLVTGANVILMQNGLGNYEILHEKYPHVSFMNGVTTEGANRKEDFYIHHAGHGETVIGSLGGAIQPDATHDLMASSLKVTWDFDIEHRLMHKLGISCCINGLTAIYRCSNGALLDGGERETAMTQLAHEVARVYTALGHGDLASTVLTESIQVALATAENRSSMLQDIESGRPTEIEYINGYLLSLAQAKDIDCPHNRHLLTVVKKLGR